MLGEMSIALGWVDWRIFFPPTDVELEIIDMAVATRGSMEEIWRWPTALRRRYAERFLEHKKAEEDAIRKAGQRQ